MATAQLVVTWILGIALGLGNIWYWWRVVKTGDDRFRARVERRYGVTIARGLRGHWEISSGERSARKRFAIEMLQLAYYMREFLVWGVLLGLGLGLMVLVDKLWS